MSSHRLSLTLFSSRHLSLALIGTVTLIRSRRLSSALGGPGTSRVYQCRQGRKGRRVFGNPCKQSGDIGEDLGTDLDICVSEGDFVLVGR